ncbi:MAG: hypothetical protein ACI3WR_02655 [Oscillospiraceae bacterium]
MEYSAQELMEKLKNDRGALEQLMHSPDGMRLMQMLTQNDGGAALKSAASSAAKGDTAQMAQMVQKLMQSPEGAALAERIRRTVGM